MSEVSSPLSYIGDYDDKLQVHHSAGRLGRALLCSRAGRRDPRRQELLVVGRSGTGKTILGLQVASFVARNGIKTLVLGIEESAEDLLATGDALGFNLSGLFAEGAIHVAEMIRPLEEPTIVSGDYDLFGLIHRIEHLAQKTGARAIVLDSATALFSPRPPQDLLRSHFLQLVHCFRRLGLTAVILAEAPNDYGQLTTLGVEDYVCDMVVIMRLAMDGERRRRSIEINKYRRSPHYKGEFPCTITTRGLAIFPLDAPDRPEAEHIQRYSSGIAGLDEMTQGGFLRNSIMLVRGPTGSGKTMLAGAYARAGALRGERVVHYGFEEPRPTLIRNFDEVGLGIGELVRAGNFKLICRYPEATSLEDLLVDLRLGLEEFQPSLVVMDSISSIEHASSEKGFRQFMIGVASKARTALCDFSDAALVYRTRSTFVAVSRLRLLARLDAGTPAPPPRRRPVCPATCISSICSRNRSMSH